MFPRRLQDISIRAKLAMLSILSTATGLLCAYAAYVAAQSTGFVALMEQRLPSRDLLPYVLTIGVVVSASLASVLVSSRLQRRISKPILDLAVLARQVSTGKSSIRAKPGGDDEIGTLIVAFNQMLSEIARREAALRSEILERQRTERDLAKARDVAEAARGQEEAARKAAEQSSLLKSTFLANMSHEIRTPLNVILGYNSLIQGALEDMGDESQKPLIEAVARAGRRLMVTVHGILDISRIESGVFEVHPAPIPLAPFVSRLVDDHRAVAEAKGLELELRVEDESAANVVFDEYCLSHSITHLLDNAIKFTERGRVTVTVSRDAQGARIEVRDTGIGIEAAYLPKVYDIFSQEQVGYARKFEGSGLGLALTKRFLDIHDAEISATSEKGVGSTFTIRIPGEWVLKAAKEPKKMNGTVVKTNGDASAPHPREDSAPILDAEAWAKPCVLLVEDDGQTQEMMQAMLRDRYRILLAGDATEARRKLAMPGEKVRVVLMDLSLHGSEDGLALTRALRVDERWRTLPIVAVTAHALSTDRENALSAGCDAYLSKPVDRSRLLSVIQGFTA